MEPTRSQMHIDTFLTNVSVAWFQSYENFVARKIFPQVQVKAQGGKYPIYSLADLTRIAAKVRGPLSESEGSGYGIASGSYFCEKYALHKDVPYEDYENADKPLDPDMDAAAYVAHNLTLQQEDTWATKYFGTGIWTGDQTGVTGTPSTDQFKQWSSSGSTPIQNIRTFRGTVQGRTGFWPNKMVIGRAAYDILCDHADIVDRIKYVMKATGKATRDAMAEIFELEEIVVADAVKNTAAEGATAAISRIFGKAALLVVAPKTASLRTVTAGLTFSWDKFDTAGTSRFDMPLKKGVRIETEVAYDFGVVAAGLGLFMTAAVA